MMGRVFKFKFQSFVDVATSAASMQVLQWSVGGEEVVKRCRHLFGAYKYFKLGKISVKMVPASTLPVDPLQLSYDPDDPQAVDPRDQMNPGLVRITNGEDVFTDISSFDEATQMRIYNSMMLDPRWSKFMLQSGFRRSAYPLYWQVGQLSQDKYPGSTDNLPNAGSSGQPVAEYAYKTSDADTGPAFRADFGSSARGLFQVGHKGRLGFLPTDYYQQVPLSGDVRFGDKYGINNVPEVSVITCVLPKAYKTLYYYRIFITEEVLFAGIRSAPWFDENNGGSIGLDNFIMSNIGSYVPGPFTVPGVSMVDNNGGKLP